MNGLLFFTAPVDVVRKCASTFSTVKGGRGGVFMRILEQEPL